MRSYNAAKNSWHAWIVCLTVSMFFLYEFMQSTIMDSISMNVMQAFHLDASELSVLAATYFYSNLFFLIPAGLLLDRYSTKKIVCCMIVVSVIGTLLFCFSNSFLLAILARFISGISGAFTFLCCVRLASKWFTSDKLAFVIGIILTIAFIGGILSHAPIVWLSETFGWRNALLILSAIGVIILIINSIFLKDMPQHDKNDVKIAPPQKFSLGILKIQLKQVASNSYTWIGSCYTSFLNLPVILLGALWGTIYLREAHNLTMSTASIISSMTFIGLIIGTPIVGYYAKSPKIISNIILYGALLSCLILPILIMYKGSSILFLILIFMSLGFFSSTQSAGYPIVLLNTKIEITSLASSIISMMVLGGGTIIKIIFGITLDFFWQGSLDSNGVRIYAPQNFQYALLIVEFFFIVSLYIAILYKNKINMNH